MSPPFLFFTGEPAVTLPLLKQHPAWSPVLSAVMFYRTNNRVHRKNSTEDDFRGVVYSADVRDKDIERHNLRIFSEQSFLCWPDPRTLLALSDRHAALARCHAAKLVNHPIVQTQFTREPLLAFPYVLKVGDEHRGEGKYLIRCAADIPQWDGMATAEPFFEGESVRVLLLGDAAFGVKIHNENNWIKNSAGARFEAWEPPQTIIEHAFRAKSLYGLDIAGVDYVVGRDGFHFIELNPFPRVGSSSESATMAREIFRLAMKRIEMAAR
jgi:hypothetical protein